MSSTSEEAFKEIKQDIVVIGCSMHNDECEHKLHPSAEDFFHIDIREEISPDLCWDITEPELPSLLIQRFKLTVTEYLPDDAINENIVLKSGEKGLQGFRNLLAMTSDDGFILIVGSPRNFAFRNALAEINYIELAKGNVFEEFPSYILLVPKDQSLSFSETMEQLERLPPLMRDTIEQACDDERYKPTHAEDFCRLNYKLSEKNHDFIKKISFYRNLREVDVDIKGKIIGEYRHQFTIPFTKKKISPGYKRGEKLLTVDILIEVLLGNRHRSELKSHRGALYTGNLGRLVRHYLAKHTLDYYIDKPTKPSPGPSFTT